MTKLKTFPTETRRQPLIREKPAPIAYRINNAAEAIGTGRAKHYQPIAAEKIVAMKCDGLTFIRIVDLNENISGSEDVGPLTNMQDLRQHAHYPGAWPTFFYGFLAAHPQIER